MSFVLVLVLPYGIAFGPVRTRIADAVSARLEGPCRIESLTFSWRTGVTAEGIEIGNPPGFPAERPCLRVRRLQADVALSSLWSGPYLATAEVDGLQLFVEQGSDGTTNLQQLVVAGPEPAQGPGGSGPRPSTPAADIAFDVQLRDSLVEVRRDGVLIEAMRDLEGRARSAGFGDRIVLDGKAQLQAGTVAVDVDFDPETAATDARLLSHGLDLSKWRPLIDAFVPGQITAIAGKVDGELRARLRAGESIELGGELIVTAPRLAGPIVRGMDLRSERWTIAPTMTLGTGTEQAVDVSRFAIDLGWLQMNGLPQTTEGTVALSYAVDLAALAAFGGPMPTTLQGTSSRLTGELRVPTSELPPDAAGWAKVIAGTAELQIAKLDLAGFALRNIGVSANVRDGACHITTAESTQLDGGPLSADVQLDLTNLEELPLTASLNWQGGQLGGGTTKVLRYAMPLLAGLDTDVAKVVGKCTLAVSLMGPAAKPADRTWLTWLDTWSGSGSFALEDAAFAPAPQLQALLSPLGPLTAGSLPIGENGQLEIDSFVAPFTFAEGVVRSKTTEWLAKGQRIGLSGTVALDGRLDYALDLSKLLEGHKDGQRVLKALQGTLPPARLAGTLDAPSLALPALGDIAKKLLEQQGRDLLQKGLDELFKKR